MTRVRQLRSVMPGAGLGAVPVVASIVLAAGVAGVLGGTGVVNMPVGETDSRLVVGGTTSPEGPRLVAAADRDAAVGLPTARRVARKTPATAERRVRSIVRLSSSKAGGAGRAEALASVARPLRTPDASVPSTDTPTARAPGGTRPDADPPKTDVGPVGGAVRDVAGGLADTVQGVTDGLAGATGGAGSPVGGTVTDAGAALDALLRKLGEGLAAVLGAAQASASASSAAPPASGATPQP